jgi:hypothetical protein
MLINWTNTNFPNANLLHPVLYIVLLDYTPLAEITQARRMVERLVKTESEIKWKDYVQAYSEADLLYRHFYGGSEDINEILSMDNVFLNLLLLATCLAR